MSLGQTCDPLVYAGDSSFDRPMQMEFRAQGLLKFYRSDFQHLWGDNKGKYWFTASTNDGTGFDVVDWIWVPDKPEGGPILAARAGRSREGWRALHCRELEGKLLPDSSWSGGDWGYVVTHTFPGSGSDKGVTGYLIDGAGTIWRWNYPLDDSWSAANAKFRRDGSSACFNQVQ